MATEKQIYFPKSWILVIFYANLIFETRSFIRLVVFNGCLQLVETTSFLYDSASAEIFATVAKLGSFTQAAENLHIRQPSVSLLIKGLEREFGIELFGKLGNKVRLTAAGEGLLQDAEEILTKVDEIKERMDEIKGLKKGKISVGGSAIAAATFLPALVQRFRKKYPGVEVSLKMQSSNDLEKELLEGKLDVAIMGLPPQSPLLIPEPFLDDEIVTIASPKCSLSRKRSVPLELVAKEPLITTKKGDPVRNIVERAFAEKGLPFVAMLEVDVQSGIRDVVKSAVASGLGIGFVSKSAVVSDVKAGRLAILKVPKFRLKRTMYIAVHKNREHVSLVQLFVEF